MWEEYLQLAVQMTSEFWPLVGTIMVVLILPMLLFQVARHSYLAARGVKELQARLEVLQKSMEGLIAGDNYSVDSTEKSGAEKPQGEAQASEPAEVEENPFFSQAMDEAVAEEEEQPVEAQGFALDGNLALDQTDFTSSRSQDEAVISEPEIPVPIQPQAKAQPKPQVKLQPQPEPMPAPEPKVQAQPEPAPAPKPKAQVQPEPRQPAAVPQGPKKPAAAVSKDRNLVQCSQCGNKLAYKNEWAGKRVKCPSCKGVISLP